MENNLIYFSKILRNVIDALVEIGWRRNKTCKSVNGIDYYYSLNATKIFITAFCNKTNFYKFIILPFSNRFACFWLSHDENTRLRHFIEFLLKGFQFSYLGKKEKSFIHNNFLVQLNVSESPRDALRCCYRRSLIYPLYRSFSLAVAAHQDVVKEGCLQIFA